MTLNGVFLKIEAEGEEKEEEGPNARVFRNVFDFFRNKDCFVDE